jgi:predicted 2-oxoglutarate/Fe(II)-dependent dioxygenase YbiX
MIKFYKQQNPMFNLHPTTVNNYNSTDVSILVETGDLILFPSNFTHEVPQTKSNETRISIAFNTFIRGYIGDEQSSTALYLH